MMYMDVNFVAILLAGVASMAVGFVWYGPLFGKPWSKLMGWTAKDMERERKKMGTTYGISFVASLVMAYVLSVVLALMGGAMITNGLMVGFWMWLGFVAPVQMTDVLFGGKSWNLYLINTGYQLASLLAMGTVLALLA